MSFSFLRAGQNSDIFSLRILAGFPRPGELVLDQIIHLWKVARAVVKMEKYPTFVRSTSNDEAEAASVGLLNFHDLSDWIGRR